MSILAKRIADLYDLEPLWKELAVITETYGELTPYLLPIAEGDAEFIGRAKRGDRVILEFGAERLEVIDAMEALDPHAMVGVRAAWEAWWSTATPVDSTERKARHLADREPRHLKNKESDT